jgi:hypothetical protein
MVARSTFHKTLHIPPRIVSIAPRLKSILLKIEPMTAHVIENSITGTASTIARDRVKSLYLSYEYEEALSL